MDELKRAEAQMADWRWVLIESGSNQDFIFRSPRRRYSVGASALLIRVETWVRQAVIAQLGRAEIIVATSSKALILVDSPATGQAIVTKVTESALVEAPGLDLWGVVERDEDMGKPLNERQSRLHELHSEVRYERPTPHRRAMMLPFLQPCSLTGIAASAMDSTGAEGNDRHPVSQQALKTIAAAKGRHDELLLQWKGHTLENLKDEITDDGWVAIVHADGNRVGELIMSASTSLNPHDTMKKVSEELQAATTTALDAAIREVGGETPTRPWVLPLIVGGDDVTVLVDGKKALRFTESYLTHFEAATSTCPTVSGLALSSSQNRYAYVTASAGVVACHSNTPFSLAYGQMDDVLGKAKTVRDLAPGRSAFSFYCAGDSVPGSAEAGPSTSAIGVSRAADTALPGPRQVRLRGDVYVTPPGATTAAPSPKWVTAHSSSTLLKAVDELISETSPVSGSMMSEVRMALGAGHVPHEILDRGNSHGPAARAFLEQHLVVDDARPRFVGTPFTRWLDLYEAVSLVRGRNTERSDSGAAVSAAAVTPLAANEGAR